MHYHFLLGEYIGMGCLGYMESVYHLVLILPIAPCSGLVNPHSQRGNLRAREA